MTSVRPMNEDEVFNEMKKMVAFIKQEALEKAREIKVKADEEFNIEKAKIVRQESLNIEAVFERKMKQAEVQKRIAQSNHINKARLRVLQERQQALDVLFEESQHKIHEISADQDKEADAEIAQFAAERASQQYQETLKAECNVTVSDNYLPASTAGGVILSGYEGKITVDNTLEARLNIVKEQMLPHLRVALFGHSPNRKFFN